MTDTVLQKLFSILKKSEGNKNIDSRKLILSVKEKILSAPISFGVKEDYFIKAIILFEEGKVGDSEALLQEVIELNPDYLEAYDLLSKIYVRLKDFKSAKICLERIIKFDSTSKEVLDDLGNIYDELGLYEEADILHQKIIDLDPNFISAYNNKAATLKKLGKHKEAVNVLLEGIEKDRRNDNRHKQLYYNLAQIYVENMLYEDAVKLFDEAIQIDPAYVSAWNDRGLNFIILGDPIEAILSFEEALKFCDGKRHSEILENLEKAKTEKSISQNALRNTRREHLLEKIALQKYEIVTPRTCLELSQIAFLEKSELPEWKCVKVTNKGKEIKGYKGSAYWNGRQQLVIAHTLSAKTIKLLNSLSDEMLLKKLLKIINYAFEFVETMKKDYPGYNVVHAGHSFAGSIAETCAIHTEDNAISFESLGSKKLCEALELPRVQENVTTYLSYQRDASTQFGYIGNPKTLNVYTATKNPSDLGKLFRQSSRGILRFTPVNQLLTAFSLDDGWPKSIATENNADFFSQKNEILLKRFSPQAQYFLAQLGNHKYVCTSKFEPEVLRDIQIHNEKVTYKCALRPEEFLIYIERQLKQQVLENAVGLVKLPDLVTALKINSEKSNRLAPDNLSHTTKHFSLINPALTITHEEWVVSLLHKPEGDNPEHAFILVEGLHSNGSVVLIKYELAYFKNECNLSTIFSKDWVCSTRDAEKYFQNEIVKHSEVKGRSWRIKREDAKRLHEVVNDSRKNPPLYQLLGDESLPAKSVSHGGHNCFTWAREMLNSLKVGQIHIERKVSDFIGAKTTLYLADSSKSKKVSPR